MSKFYRINQYIRSPEVRVVDHQGAQIGVLKTEAALAKAKEQNLDLVEVAPKAQPPVVKIIDFAKFKYQEAKKQRSGQKPQPDTKEVRFSPFMDENGIKIRLKRANSFLKAGNRVKLVVKFSGRQITHKEFGEKLLENVLEQLKEVSSLVEKPKLTGKFLNSQVKPKK